MPVARHDRPHGQQITWACHGAVGPVLLRKGEEAVEGHHNDKGEGQLRHAGNGREASGDPLHRRAGSAFAPYVAWRRATSFVDSPRGTLIAGPDRCVPIAATRPGR